MKLTERYRRLTFWNKLNALGALASILGIPIAVALFLLSDGAGNGDVIPADAGRYAAAIKGDTVAGAGVVAVAGEGAIHEAPYTVSGSGTVRDFPVFPYRVGTPPVNE